MMDEKQKRQKTKKKTKGGGLFFYLDYINTSKFEAIWLIS